MSGFVDLRLNHQEGQVNESFWPSFTDIMTVVMMIFLIAMVVLLMRNMELVSQLRHTMEAERQAAEQAAQTGAANNALLTKLSEAQAQIAQLQQQLATAQAQHQQDQSTITGQQDQITTLMSDRNDLAEQLALARISLEEQRKLVADSQQHADELQQQITNLNARLTNAMSQRDDLDSQLTKANQALADADREHQANHQQYRELVGKYDQLRVKYDKLMRPARSPLGHFLVEVRYTEHNGSKLIDFREDGKGDFIRMDPATLKQRLAVLKHSHNEGLYVKIIIPEDSGLSYTEAWSFTRDILAHYDYYYEGQADELPPDR